MRNAARLTTAAIIAAAAILTACSGSDRDVSADSAAKADVEAPPASSSGRSGASLAADSIGITNRSGDVLLSVAHDSVSMGFSPSALDKIRRETDTTRSASGLGGMIERTVKSSVQSMLSTRIMVPVDDIESVRYEDGAIRFTYRSRPRGMKLEDIKVDDRPVLESFSEPDARLFVSAVRARLRLR